MDSIIVAADIHLRNSAPRYRKDTYHLTQFAKVEFQLEQCRIHNAALVWAGDVFDKRDSPAWHLNMYMDLFLNSGVEVYVVFGNHDQYYHSAENKKTQLGSLIISKAVKLLGKVEIGGMTIVGRSWGEPYPKPEGKFNVLIAHETVTDGVPPPWMTGAVSSKTMINNNPGYEYIVTGDYHEPHHKHYNGCQLINTGPMTRDEVTKINYQPKCYLLSVDHWSIIDIPIEPDVFDTDAIDLAKQYKTGSMSAAQLNAFEKAMDINQDARPTFTNTAMSLLETITDEEAKRIAKEILADVCGN